MHGSQQASAACLQLRVLTVLLLRRQVEVAVMDFRDELQEAGGLSRQQIDGRVRVKRAQLAVEAEREAAAAAASKDGGRGSGRCLSRLLSGGDMQVGATAPGQHQCWEWECSGISCWMRVMPSLAAVGTAYPGMVPRATESWPGERHCSTAKSHGEALLLLHSCLSFLCVQAWQQQGAGNAPRAVAAMTATLPGSAPATETAAVATGTGTETGRKTGTGTKTAAAADPHVTGAGEPAASL